MSQDAQFHHGNRFKIDYALTVRLRVCRHDTQGALFKVHILPFQYEQFAAATAAIQRSQDDRVSVPPLWRLAGLKYLALFLGRKYALARLLQRHRDNWFTVREWVTEQPFFLDGICEDGAQTRQ